MDKRDEKGLIIAAIHKLQNKKGLWLVPSQSAKHGVDLAATCTLRRASVPSSHRAG